MGQLIPENTSRKIDSLGRITIPKGLRDRMSLSENSELELFTATLDGRHCICLASPVDEEERAIEFLRERGYKIDKQESTDE